MNRTKYAVIVLLSIVPFVTMPMDPQHALSKSKQKFRVKATQGEYITPRSDKRKRRLLSEEAALPSVPVYGLKQVANSGRELSRSPQVTIRKKTPSTSVNAKTLYDQAIFLYPAKSGSHLNNSTSIAQKIGFDESIKRRDVDKVFRFLKTNNGLRTSYPLAIKLHAVMVCEANTLNIHPSEAAIIPVQDICAMAKSLAILGHNKSFLEEYACILKKNPEMRKIINGD